MQYTVNNKAYSILVSQRGNWEQNKHFKHTMRMNIFVKGFMFIHSLLPYCSVSLCPLLIQDHGPIQCRVVLFQYHVGLMQYHL